MAKPPRQFANLAMRAIDVENINLPGAERRFLSGRAVMYRLPLSPSPASRIYTCELLVWPRRRPEMHVISPDLQELAEGRAIPHIYPTDRQGTRLCLYLPRLNEWQPEMRLSETFVPWTLEWLWYFEVWLATDVWEGGGEHPQDRRRRYGVSKSKRDRNSDD
ncbi:hypothetical protein FCL38_24570 [Pseudoduganella umbonata]|uniref:Type II CBASS E2 protein domain-containing protein n=1 Tax=Pseudoduganella umbonata TaxID=864828 RepID=A0ABX5USN0_9BURK|nr:hypothetical protein FCL38_24570 [Pseudoduganella umbonata]